MKKLFAVLGVLFVCAITNVVNAQLPEGYATYGGVSTETTSVTTTTDDNDKEEVVSNNTTNKSHVKNQSRIDKIKSKAWVYKNGGRSNTTSVSSNTNYGGNQNSSNTQTTKVVHQGDGSGGQVAVSILMPIVNLGIRIGLSYLPRSNNGMNTMGYYSGYGYGGVFF